MNVFGVAVGNVAAQRRRENAVTVGKERRDALMRTKRLCREGVTGDSDVAPEADMMIDEEQSILEVQTSSAVEELKLAVAHQYVNYHFLYIYIYTHTFFIWHN